MTRYWEKPKNKKSYKKSNGWSGDKFYQSKVWRATRNAYMQTRKICLYCKYQGTYSIATVCDHIVPRRFSGCDYCETNLQPLCVSCHNTKSAYERNNGVDPITQQIYKIKKLGDAIRPEAEEYKKTILERYIYQV